MLLHDVFFSSNAQLECFHTLHPPQPSLVLVLNVFCYKSSMWIYQVAVIAQNARCSMFFPQMRNLNVLTHFPPQPSLVCYSLVCTPAVTASLTSLTCFDIHCELKFNYQAFFCTILLVMCHIFYLALWAFILRVFFCLCQWKAKDHCVSIHTSVGTTLTIENHCA